MPEAGSNIDITGAGARFVTQPNTTGCWRSAKSCRPFGARSIAIWPCPGCRVKRSWPQSCDCSRSAGFESATKNTRARITRSGLPRCVAVTSACRGRRSNSSFAAKAAFITLWAWATGAWRKSSNGAKSCLGTSYSNTSTPMARAQRSARQMSTSIFARLPEMISAAKISAPGPAQSWLRARCWKWNRAAGLIWNETWLTLSKSSPGGWAIPKRFAGSVTFTPRYWTPTATAPYSSSSGDARKNPHRRSRMSTPQKKQRCWNCWSVARKLARGCRSRPVYADNLENHSSDRNG